MAGTLRAEATLALANLVYIVLLGVGGVVFPLTKFPAAARPFLTLLPTGALATGLRAVLADAAGVRSGTSSCSRSRPSWGSAWPRARSLGVSTPNGLPGGPAGRAGAGRCSTWPGRPLVATGIGVLPVRRGLAVRLFQVPPAAVTGCGCGAPRSCC